MNVFSEVAEQAERGGSPRVVGISDILALNFAGSGSDYLRSNYGHKILPESRSPRSA
jgi:hypothetical protein